MNKNYSIIAVLLVLAGFFVIADNGKKYGQVDFTTSKVITQTTTMYHHDDVYSLTRADDVAGSSATITRTDAGVGIQFNTSELPAGAYTVWLLVYNNPEECADGDCDLPDIDPGTPAVSPGAIRIGQDYISNTDGAMSITAWVPAGDTVGSEGSTLLPGSLFGSIENPMTAEFDVILKWHGKALTSGDDVDHDLLDEQLHDIQGGCFPGRADMDPAPIELDNGFLLCPDPQGATFVNPFAK